MTMSLPASVTPTESPAPANADSGEIAKFEALAARWWDPESEFRPLHRINPLRLGWIEQLAGTVSGRDVIDVPDL